MQTIFNNFYERIFNSSDFSHSDRSKYNGKVLWLHHSDLQCWPDHISTVVWLLVQCGTTSENASAGVPASFT